MEKLKQRWGINSNWQVAVILIVFSITGTTASFIGKPILALLNITPETFNSFIYWTLRIIILFVMYQFLLVFFGWLFGQFDFFWNFVKKMLTRMGFKQFAN
ncbi:DUF6787 family protein [Lacinutrix iliipiscaria]|uniref:DUF6787 family protein n=1 Tax=Lacinutrix iliipiscaria TaxID=1230532 RepID=A0ABW5WNY6_9FLAO